MENKGQTRKCEIQIQLLIKFLFHHLNIIYIILDIHSGSAKTPTSHHIRKWTSIFCTDPRQVSSQSLMGIIFLSIMYCSSYLYIESHLCVFRHGPTRSNSAWPRAELWLTPGCFIDWDVLFPYPGPAVYLILVRWWHQQFIETLLCQSVITMSNLFLPCWTPWMRMIYFFSPGLFFIVQVITDNIYCAPCFALINISNIYW